MSVKAISPVYSKVLDDVAISLLKRTELGRKLLVLNSIGNGLFLFGMARRRKDFNFLGLEINRKVELFCRSIFYSHALSQT